MNWQQYQDDVLVAISEGVIEPETEYLPLVVMKTEGPDKTVIYVDEEVHKTVDSTEIFQTPLRLMTKELKLNSAAIEVKPSDPTTRVGVLLPPHISMLPGKALWKAAGSPQACFLVTGYKPLAGKGQLEVVKFVWKGGTLRVLNCHHLIKTWARLGRQGKLKVFDIEADNAPEELKAELKKYGA